MQYTRSVGIPPPHPRLCTTDNVECFFCIMRDNVGKNFTLKHVSMVNFHYLQIIYTYLISYCQVFHEWRKICFEFAKRIDPDLPFYYYTTSDRFYDSSTPLPSFDKPLDTPKKPKRVP